MGSRDVTSVMEATNVFLILATVNPTNNTNRYDKLRTK